MQKKRVYVCCGSGIATSTVIAKKVKEVLEKNHIPYDLKQYTVQQISSKVRTLKPDIIISSTMVSGDVLDVPVVLGRSFLTGIKKEETIEEILAVLKD
ncbi:PTS sugar transporter subunit IIB [Listeria ilorinensis]|uniref:PTS sugar transporter subunit IIB n=1 Tax=Listeria ilorinensis TaxID=2867439 RepID=UPI001EF51C11|nr:PTS sugar transporter subunit IIB [Listeria ilorinensis]